MDKNERTIKLAEIVCPKCMYGGELLRSIPCGSSPQKCTIIKALEEFVTAELFKLVTDFNQVLIEHGLQYTLTEDTKRKG